MGLTIIQSIKEPLDIPETLANTLIREGVDCNLCYIEELAFFNFDYIGNNLKETIYFFNNTKLASTLVHILLHNHREVINDGYLQKSFSKETTQLLLIQNGFKIPDNYFSPEISRLSKMKDKIHFPLILKSFRHSEKYMVIHSYLEYMNVSFWGEVNHPVYAEEYLTANCKVFKIYCIDETIYFDSFGEQIKTQLLINDMRKIGSIFSLGVFSVDCIFNHIDKSVSVIDVNPSPAFGGSEVAGKDFIKYLKEKSEKHK